MDENFTELKGEIAGPPDTPYEGWTLLIALLDCCHDLCICMRVVGQYGQTELMRSFFNTGGRYQLEIKIPETYPFNPPKVIVLFDSFS